jgi:iron(III) transport system ATP-binding protein
VFPARRQTATLLRHDFHSHDALVALRLADGTEVSARILDDGGEILPVGAGVGLRVEGAARAWYAD